MSNNRVCSIYPDSLMYYYKMVQRLLQIAFEALVQNVRLTVNKSYKHCRKMNLKGSCHDYKKGGNAIINLNNWVRFQICQCDCYKHLQVSFTFSAMRTLYFFSVL